MVNIPNSRLRAFLEREWETKILEIKKTEISSELFQV